MFKGVNYQFWKVKMKIFIESFNRWICDTIVNSLFIPKHLFIPNLGLVSLKLMTAWQKIL